MNGVGLSPEKSAQVRQFLTRTRNIPAFKSAETWIEKLSPGDKIIFYTLAVLLVIAAVAGFYALENSLLVTVPAYGGSLTEGDVGSPRFINPLLALTDADSDLATLTYAGLMGISGTGTLVPVLAQSYTVSPDGKVYTFTLKKNLKFSDGTPLTANDVVFTVQKAQDPALKSPLYADWSGVDVAAIDSQTVQFTLSTPYAPFLQLTTLGILPSHLWENISDEEFPFSVLETNPVGDGPFTVSSVNRDASGLIQSVSLSENPEYALGRPYLNSIQMVFYAEIDGLAQALSSGAVQSAYGVSVPGALTAPYSRVFGVFFNQSQDQVFARPEVRKALSIAIDRDSIVSNVLSGYGEPIMGPVPPGAGIQQVAVPQSANPTADAAAVLTAAGWQYDSNARVWKLGTKETLSSITIRTSNVPELKEVASAVRDDWEKLGISVDIELYEPGDLSQNVIRPRQFDTLLYGMVIGRDEDLYAFWDSKEKNDPGLNIAQYTNSTVDSLLADARGNPSASTRTADLQKIEDTVASDYPAAFLYAPDFIYAIPSDLRGVELPQITTPSDRFATVADWYRVTDSVWPFFTNLK